MGSRSQWATLALLALCVAVAQAQCGTGTYQNTAGNCVNCGNYCTTCNGGPNKCTGCTGSTRVLHNGQCLSSCPSGWYKNGNTCAACPAGCATCNGTVCLTCTTAGHIVAGNTCIACSTYVYNGGCVATCPDGTYTSGNQCLSCRNTCATCSNGNGCLTCNAAFPNRGPTANRCYADSCDAYLYLDAPNKLCRSCHSNCATCNGTLADNCLTCRPASAGGQKPYRYQGKCVAACPAHHGADANGECFACHEYCNTCNGPLQTDCTSCQAAPTTHTKTHFRPATGQCYTNCPISTFELGNGNCDECIAPCSACSGTSSTCIACPPGLAVQGGTCVACEDGQTAVYGPAGGCVDLTVEDCPDGTYDDDDWCLPCHPTCGTCGAFGVTSCTSCAPGRHLMTDRNVCVLNCPEGRFVNTDTNTCDKCHSRCAACTGPFLSACTACRTNSNARVLIAGDCLSCPVGTFVPHASQATSFSECTGTCHSSCKQCTGPADNQCVSCRAGFSIIGGSCL